ncbi:hypothetical protein F5B21DRAFT_504279 [Xylaria acuta]|nr:hypothetical protein F5B21DRAFT_504279 [Xylaria acuta]
MRFTSPSYQTHRAPSRNATLRFRENGVIDRPPTFEEAEAFWKMNKTTVANWWSHRAKYLSPDDYDSSNELPVFPETLATAGAVNIPGTDDDSAGDFTKRPPPNVMEVSRDSDIELDGDQDELHGLDAEPGKP